MFLYQCEVRGCVEDSIVGVFHKIYGKGDYCSGHNPIHAGYAKLITGASIAHQDTPAQPNHAAESALSNEQLIAQMLKEIIRLALNGESDHAH